MEKENHVIDRLLRNRWLMHFLFWASLLISAPFTSTQGIDEMKEAFFFRAVGIPIKMIATYLLVYFQIPYLLQKRKYIQFVLSLAVSILFFTILYRFNNIHIAERLAYPQEPRESLGQ
ncbi:MAG: hypothetical protein AAGE93_28050, partial [Bacteroidota bacterium]